MSNAKDLTKQAPASPRVRTGGYATLARMADKGRADIAGTAGDYNFDCPLDKHLLDFKSVTGAEVRKQLENGASDEVLAKWLDANGTPRTEAEKTAFNEESEASSPYGNPDKKEWFTGACEKVGLDPASATKVWDLLSERVDAFIDRLLSLGEPAGFVLHGHGTGALKSAVREHLRKAPHVARAEPAEQADGGDAFTVLWLR